MNHKARKTNAAGCLIAIGLASVLPTAASPGGVYQAGRPLDLPARSRTKLPAATHAERTQETERGGESFEAVGTCNARPSRRRSTLQQTACIIATQFW